MNQDETIEITITLKVSKDRQKEDDGADQKMKRILAAAQNIRAWRGRDDD